MTDRPNFPSLRVGGQSSELVGFEADLGGVLLDYALGTGVVSVDLQGDGDLLAHPVEVASKPSRYSNTGQEAS